MDIEVRHHGSYFAPRPALTQLVTDQRDRQKMSADGEVRIVFADEFQEFARVGLFDARLNAPPAEGLIGGLVKPSEDLRRLAHQLQIRVPVKLVKRSGGELKNIAVLYLEVRALPG